MYQPIAYTWHAAVFCRDCGIDLPPVDQEGNDKNPVFDGLYRGECCEGCGALYVSGEWQEKPTVRWAICRECNAHQAYERDGYEYRDARRAAYTGTLDCECCAKPAVHF